MLQKFISFFVQPYVSVALGALIISLSPVFVRLTTVSPDSAAFYRVFFGGLVLMLIAVARKEKIHAGRKMWVFVALAGLFFAADLQFWHRSVGYVGPGLATILGNLQVFCTAAFGALLFKEVISKRLIIALPIAVVGLLLLIGLDIEHISEDVFYGIVFGLLTAVAYSCYIMSLRQSQSAGSRLPLFANMGIISLVTAAVVAVFMLGSGDTFAISTSEDWGYLLAYGILCQGIGWAFISKGLPYIPAAIAGLIMLLQPSLAFVWDVLFFNRPTGAYGMLGVALVLFGIGLGILGQQSAARSRNKRAGGV